ncbi:YciI family protein [Ktedonospora formicarum]|uniref:YCII-related domain-containing protein n=1 Tax=Ktedonospora formicarum TaxID=2778364 RepID=A0A8J3MUG7_9CHLR|nr:YciI family protein [Ktedonospora formicarum]GHO49332.1 hypothetical protein KSX_74950 [Ktedonospora formicarum]
MRYLLLIYTNEVADAQVSDEENAKIYQAYTDYGNEVEKRGVHIDSKALQPTSTATTVRLREGKVLTTDGPFAETKEQLGGYYLLNCKDLDEAIELAAKIPGAANGSIEVRPIMEFE